MAMVNMNNLINGKDSRWLQLEVCREFQRNKCTRPDTECKFAHPPPNVEVQNGKVTACYDSIKVCANFLFYVPLFTGWLNYLLKRLQTTFPWEKTNISFVFKKLFPLGPSRDKLGNKGEDLTLLKQQRGGSAVGGQYLRSNLEAVWGLWMSYLRGLYGFQAIDSYSHTPTFFNAIFLSYNRKWPRPRIEWN